MIQICGHTVRILFDLTEGSFQILWKSTNFVLQEFFSIAGIIIDSGPKWTVLNRTERSFASKWTVLGIKSGLLDGPF